MIDDSFERVVIRRGVTIREAIRAIDKGGMQFILVVNDNGTLYGIVTDGDVRRGILRNISLDACVEEICNTTPLVGSVEDPSERLDYLMLHHDRRQIPVLDGEGRLVRVKYVDEILRPKRRDNLVVIMAGGKGKRLLPLTEQCPKPLLNVCEKPILESILESFMYYGFWNIAISVNYKAQMIKEYFVDGSRWNAQIRYIDESEPLGTAGALSLLSERPSQPFFVINGDLLTNVNFTSLLDFHIEHESTATMCVRKYEMEVPYGVVTMNDCRVMDIIEKPVERYFVNAGIYVLSPDCLDSIPTQVFFDMPDMIKALIAQGKAVCSFPMREYWMDIGRIGDFERANLEYKHCFPGNDGKGN